MTLPFSGSKYHVIIWLVGLPLLIFLAVSLVHLL